MTALIVARFDVKNAEKMDAYPHPDLETPTDVQEIVRELVETPQEKALNEQVDRADVQFFKERNPGYPRGHGLVVVVPLTWGNLTAALLSRLHERALIAFGRRKAQL